MKTQHTKIILCLFYFVSLYFILVKERICGEYQD